MKITKKGNKYVISGKAKAKMKKFEATEKPTDKEDAKDMMHDMVSMRRKSRTL